MTGSAGRDPRPARPAAVCSQLRAQRDLLDAYGGHGQLRTAVADGGRSLARQRARPWPRSSSTRPRSSAGSSSAPTSRTRSRRRRSTSARSTSSGPAWPLRVTPSAWRRLRLRRTTTWSGRARRARSAGPRRPGDERGRSAGRPFRIAGRAPDGPRARRCDDVAADLRRLAEAIDHDPSVVIEIETRLGVLYGLMRKYGPDEAAVMAEGERARAEVERADRDGRRAPGSNGRRSAASGAGGRGGGCI